MNALLNKNIDRSRLAIVLSSNFSPSILQQFCSLSRHFEVTVFLLADGYSNHPIPGSFNLELFYQDQNLPGYMRGLEKRLSEYEVVLGIGALNVATHQAFRFAQNHDLPFVLYEAVLSDKEKNMHEFFLGCDLVVSPFDFTIQGSTQKDANKVLVFSPPLKYDARFKKEAREKFRSYFKFSPEDKVISIVGNGFRKDDALVKHLIAKAQELPDLKILIHCDKNQSEEIKYLMVASSVAKRFFFIHQSIEPFAFDLLAASDVIFFTEEWRKQNADRQFFYTKDMEGLGLAAAVLEINDVLFEGASSPSGLKALVELKCREKVDHLNDEEALVKRLLLNADRFAIRELDEDNLSIDAKIDQCKSKKRRSELYCQKANHLIQNGHSDEAIEALEKSVQNEPSVAAYLELGFLALKTQAYDEAVVFFRKVLTLEAKNHRAFWGLGLVYRKVGLVGEAVYYLDLCIRLGMDQDYVITALVQTLSEVKDHNLAIKVLEDLVEMVGENKTLMRALGSTLIKSGETSKGYSILDKFIS